MARGIRIVGAGAEDGTAGDGTPGDGAAVEEDAPQSRPSRAEKRDRRRIDDDNARQAAREQTVAAGSRRAAAATAAVPPGVSDDADDNAPRTAEKAWSGRLGAKTARRVEEYTTSIAVDRRLYPEDIAGSQAHARMLRHIGILTREEHSAIDRGLREIKRELDKGEFPVDPGDEDIHMAVERRLGEKVGEVAGKLHTARSRNDQVATDLRLYGKRVCRELMLGIASLQEALMRRAQEHRESVMPGYTHLQRAQVVSLAHHLLAYVEMLQRDIERLEDAHDRCNVLPLGSGALAGTTLPINRRMVADELGFDTVSANSLDAVSDRDFAVEIVAAAALLMVHLSRLGEEIVLWSSQEFGFAELPDAYATGSSLMPQKKNPDVLELARGRAGRTLGDLVALLTTLKGLPLSYNRDLQEDKPPFFDAVDVAMQSVAVVTDVVKVLRFDVDAMRAAASDPFLMATDIADYLVIKGVPFRDAHRIVGRVVRDLQKQRRSFADMALDDWREHSPLFDEDVLELFDVSRSLRRKEVVGGPGPKMVSRQLVRAATLVAKTRRLVPVMARQTSAAKEVGAAVHKRTTAASQPPRERERER
ncbi:MAG TPA: argininosuccinate lyase [Candidatus Dormibacteraeota bacterium]|nr:argininosuccinate lyase [Candidatus Dormibacteraeota bacterium]